MTGNENSPLFGATRWSIVLAAGEDSGPERDAALEELCRSYWYPIYAFIRGRGRSPQDAEDLTQEFIASLLRRGSFANLSPERGRFRSFLLAALKYFLADAHAHASAAKRGGGIAPLALDALSPEERYALEPAAGDSPDAEFDRRWASALSELALARLHAEVAAGEGGQRFEELKPFLTAEPAAGEYARIAASWGVPENTVAQQVRRLRQRLRRLLVEEAAGTVATPGEAEAELRALFT